MTDRIAQILDDAAGVIETRGWNQGGYIPEKDADRSSCPVCVLAAISVASGLDPTTDLYESTSSDANVRAAAALAEHLGLGLLHSPIDVVDEVGEKWNDDIAESPEQVTRALRECAAELKAGA